MNIEELNTALAQIFASDDLLKNEPMSKHTTFRCGGPAQFFVRASNAADITAAISAAEKADAPWWIVGCGSDLLVSDAGLPGVVIEIGERMAHISIDGSIVHAQAGATNEAVAQAALEAELTGYEFASGIPGSVGGAAIMNAGAYDGEFKDVAVSVSCLFPDGTVREIPAEEADWSYRHSMMSDKGLVVLGATLNLRQETRMRFAPRWTTCPNAALPSSLSKWQAQAARSSAQKAILQANSFRIQACKAIQLGMPRFPPSMLVSW